MMLCAEFNHFVQVIFFCRLERVSVAGHVAEAVLSLLLGRYFTSLKLQNKLHGCRKV